MSLLWLLSACIFGVNPGALSTHDLYADDGETKESKARFEFAVIGDTRGQGPEDRATGRVPTAGAEAAIVADVSAQVEDGLDMVLLLGNMVARSSTANWRAFAKDWQPVLSGSELSETGAARVRVSPVAGASDRLGDYRLRGWGASFPNAGAEIGYNRVASWYAYDVVVMGKTWRFLVLDSDKAHLGSRWQEQLTWVAEAGKGDFAGILIFMNQPRHTLALKQSANPDDGPAELIAAVEDVARLNMIKAVFAADTGANEVFLPFGRMGELYVNANSGAPAASLARWRYARADGEEDLRLEPLYDLALLRQFDAWASAMGFPETVVDRAKARGSYEGFTGELDAKSFPNQGWWGVTLVGERLRVRYRTADPTGAFQEAYHADYDPKEGWKTGS